MALRDITNHPGKWRLHVDLEQEYATLRSLRAAHGVDIPRLRMQGCKALDLWTDGALYPRDPFTGETPPFCNLTMMLRFVGDGLNGLLGYCNRLWSVALHEAGRRREVEAKYESLQSSSSTEIAKLKEEIIELTADLANQMTEVHKFIKKTDNYVSLQQSARNMRRRIDHLTHLPMGCCLRKRKVQCVEVLAKKGGALKRRVQKTRALAGSILGMDSGETDARMGLAKHMLKSTDLITLLQQPSNARVRETLRQKFYKELVGLVTPRLMLETCDAAGISKKGYEAVYRVITLAHRERGFIQPLLPTPFSISMAKVSANCEVASLFGGYKFVADTMPLPNSCSHLYNEFNNIYIDPVKLQQAMVQYYGITPEECNNKLIFVLKLDECQVVKGQRLERVSLTLMNRALQGIHIEQPVEEESTVRRRQARTHECFGIQSEKHIWWLAAFTLSKETHETLEWYLRQTSIPSTISNQSQGQKVHVSGIGNFEVEWHLAGDLKTLKCMFGCKLGATTKFPCIYCLHSRDATNVCKTVSKGRKLPRAKQRCNGILQNQGQASNSSEWFQGILSCDRRSTPNRDVEDREWAPILAIPLTRVHICSLHARLRILDKILKLHINYAWNMEPVERRESCIRDLEAVLNGIGLHGGMVKLHKDPKSSGTTQNNPGKVCMGGPKARHLLSNHSNSRSHTEWEAWKKICDVTTYRGNDARMGLLRAKVWEAVDTMVAPLEKANLSEQEVEDLKVSIETFTRCMIDAWGETHITHYMHILYAHAGYFLDQYGSLALWSTQGMERSHYQAKGSYFKNTRHGGGVTKSNALQEMFNWFYRTVGGRKTSKNLGTLRLRRTVRVVVSSARTRASNSREAMRRWMSTRRRNGSRWVPMS